MKKKILMTFFLLTSANSVVANEISFAEFTKLKESAIEAGKMIGGLQACSSANAPAPGVSNAFSLLADKRTSDFREILGATQISRSDMSIIDDTMTAEAKSIKENVTWANQVSLVRLATNECNIGYKVDVCCAVKFFSSFTDVYAQEVNWDTDKSPENALNLLSKWGMFVGVSPIE